MAIFRNNRHRFRFADDPDTIILVFPNVHSNSKRVFQDTEQQEAFERLLAERVEKIVRKP